MTARACADGFIDEYVQQLLQLFLDGKRSEGAPWHRTWLMPWHRYCSIVQGGNSSGLGRGANSDEVVQGTRRRRMWDRSPGQGNRCLWGCRFHAMNRLRDGDPLSRNV